MRKFIIINKVPVEMDDLLEWAKLFESSGNNRTINRTTWKKNKTDKEASILVSTVFLPLCHNHGAECTKDNPCILFETMIFDKQCLLDISGDEWQMRYATVGEAEYGHEKAVEMVETTLKKKKINLIKKIEV